MNKYIEIEKNEFELLKNHGYAYPQLTIKYQDVYPSFYVDTKLIPVLDYLVSKDSQVKHKILLIINKRK